MQFWVNLIFQNKNSRAFGILHFHEKKQKIAKNM